MKKKKVIDDSATYDHIKLTEEQVKNLVENIVGIEMDDSIAADLLLLLYAVANAARNGSDLDVEHILVPAEEAAMANSRASWKALHITVNSAFDALQSEGRAH